MNENKSSILLKDDSIDYENPLEFIPIKINRRDSLNS